MVFSFTASTFVAQFCTHSRASLIGLSMMSKSRLPSSWRTPKRKPQEWWAGSAYTLVHIGFCMAKLSFLILWADRQCSQVWDSTLSICTEAWQTMWNMFCQSLLFTLLVLHVAFCFAVAQATDSSWHKLHVLFCVSVLTGTDLLCARQVC